MLSLIINEDSPTFDGLIANPSLGGIGALREFGNGDSVVKVSLKSARRIDGIITDQFVAGDTFYVGIGDGTNAPVCSVTLSSASPALGDLAINTSGMVALFAATAANQLTLFFSVYRVRASGESGTIFQKQTVIHRAAIDPSTAVPAPSLSLLAFKTYAVSGQDSVVAAVPNDTVTFVAVGGTITTNAATKTITWTSASGAAWGTITGTLSAQTDLQNALNAKQDALTLGAGVSGALGISINAAGGIVTFNGDAGTPSALVGTNITGTAEGLTAGLVTSIGDLTGDMTSSNRATTLATVNSTTGTFGDPANYATFTVNDKGLVTASSQSVWPTFNQNTSGNAATVTVTDATGGNVYAPVWFSSTATGSLAPSTDGNNFRYNPSIKTLLADKFQSNPNGVNFGGKLNMTASSTAAGGDILTNAGAGGYGGLINLAGTTIDGGVLTLSGGVNTIYTSKTGGGITATIPNTADFTFTGNALTQTLTNKTMDGGSNTFTNISGSSVTGGTFGAVNGSAITTLNASNLASGTVADGRLPAAVANITSMSALGTIGGLTTVTGAGAMSLTGGAGNMTITSGTGNSRTLILRTTNSSGTAQTVLTLNSLQEATLSGGLMYFSGGSSLYVGAAGGELVLNNVSGGATSIYGTSLRFRTSGLDPAVTVSSAGAVAVLGTLAVTGASALTGGVTIGSTGTAITSHRILTSGAMVGGTVTVTDTAAASTTKYFPIVKTIGTVTVPSACYASTINVGASVVLTASVPTDTSTWYIIAIN